MDMELGKEGDIAKYPSPDELWEMCYPTPVDTKKVEQTLWRDKLFSVPFEDRGGSWQPRYYQENAITKAIEAVAAEKDRILLTLATGSGKTAIAFHIAWKLFQSKWNLKRDGSRRPRILFLADRNLLADQAFNAFSAFEDDARVRIRPSEIKKKGAVPKNGSMFFTIFQSFMSGDNDSPYFGEYPQDYFDFIIIDECHRGGANDESSWRAIMEHFSPAVQLGLTATPKRDVNADTYDYFGEPVYEYSLKSGINDGFLTPFQVKSIDTTIDEYVYTPDDEVIEGEIDAKHEYTEEEFNRIIEIQGREEYRVKIFMDLINQNQKTLVFCATQKHAAAIRNLINQYADSPSPNYCHRVTADDGSLGEQHLSDFQDNEKSVPTVLTTSQKLSTGVDAPEIRNIVLLRPVKSMVEFKQIVGRGTRLYDGKDYFTIYDFVEAYKHFNDDEWDGPPLPPEEGGEGGEEREPCKECGFKRCICGKEPEPTCYVCKNDPCVCEKELKKIVRVKLAEHRFLELDSMVKTSFYNPDGAPITAAEFIKKLFGDIPSLFSSEEELRKIWSLPDTRKKLLLALADKGYAPEQLDELKRLIHAEESDLYDVLSYIAYHKDMLPRTDRAEQAKVHFINYNEAQREFLNFVLKQYVQSGVSELDDAKLADLLILKYNALADAKHELGDIKSIRDTFVGFQTHLYEEMAA
jgi:type I restriction enzyme R subunit